MKSRPPVVYALLVAGLILLSVLLYFANRVPAFAKEGQTKIAQQGSGLDPFVNNAVAALQGGEKANWAQISGNASSSNLNTKKSWLDSAILFWDKNKRPDIAAAFASKKAEAEKTAKSWFYAGQRNYYAVRFTEDPAMQKALYASAIRAYEAGLHLEPSNTDAKIDLASSYVEGSADPMKGIAMLQEIEQKDSNNVKLQLNFGFFSGKSQQWDKAIQRFKKVLQIDSTYIEAWLHLADAYEQNGQIEESIAALENFSARTDDVMAKTAINEYVLQLKKEHAATNKKEEKGK